MKKAILLTIAKVGGSPVTAYQELFIPDRMQAIRQEGSGVRFIYDGNEYTTSSLTLAQLEAQMNNESVAGKICLVGVIDFALGHAATGSYTLKDVNGNALVIPDNSRVHSGFMETETTFTGASATIALGYTPDGTTTAILNTTTATTLTAGTKTALTPVGTAATASAKTTAARNITLTIATAALTAGKAYVYLEIVTTA